jgi:hypothetical protein
MKRKIVRNGNQNKLSVVIFILYLKILRLQNVIIHNHLMTFKCNIFQLECQQ